jgi:hypothetical protein
MRKIIPVKLWSGIKQMRDESGPLDLVARRSPLTLARTFIERQKFKWVKIKNRNRVYIYFKVKKWYGL